MSKIPPNDHVVIFNAELIEFGGEERVMLALARELHHRSIKCSFASYWDKINLPKYCEWPIEMHQLKPKRNPISKVLALRHFLNDLRNQGSPTPILFNIQAAYHAGLTGAGPYHIRIPDTYRLLSGESIGHLKTRGRLSNVKRSMSKRLSHWGTKRGIQGAESFITNTKVLQTEMLALYGRRAEVIYLGGLGTPNENIPARANGLIELLTVSRLQASKRIDWILESLDTINVESNKCPAWRLHVVGAGPEREKLEQQCKILGLQNFVIFHGFVNDVRLHELYQLSHAFLMPGKQGYGLPMIEALYQKMAVVSSEESGAVELFENTNWVSIAREGKAGFTKALKEMLHRLADPAFFTQPLPPLPTEKEWASQMIRQCNWVA